MTGRPLLTGALHAAWGYAHTPPPALRASQDAALRRLVLHAYEQVRWYRRLFDRHRLHPRHIRGVVDLDLIPPTERSERGRQRPADLLVRGTIPETLVSVPASDDVTLRRTSLEDLLHLLHRVRTLGALGLQPGRRVAMLSEDARGNRERHGLALRLLGMHRRRVFDGLADPSALAEAVAGFEPEVLAGTPATLDRLASRAARVRPALVVVEGTPPLPRLRARLAAAFDAPVRATYGLGAETPLAVECPLTGWYHVSEGWALVEVLVDGRPAEIGQRGEVAVTLLHSYAMPVLRLRLGHVATRGGPCGCGAAHSTLLAPDA